VIVIGARQMQAFRQSVTAAFEDRMRAHVRACKPTLCEAAGDDNIRRFVRVGLERAVAHGFTRENTVQLFIELMLEFGHEFDSDPQFPWVREILATPYLRCEEARSTVLFRQATGYLDDVMGPGNIRVVLALNRLKSLDLGTASAGIRAITHALQQAYPEKCRRIGGPGVRAVVDIGADLANVTALGVPWGTALMARLVFAFGHGVATDPIYSWIGLTLRHEPSAEVDERATRLHDLTVAYLERACEELERG
jgi:hypothetical protein